VSVSTPAGDKLFTSAGYAEVASEAPGGGAPSERYVVNDLWEFAPYRESTNWGWTKFPQDNNDGVYVPGPRLATALATVPRSDDGSAKAVLLGGWDPRTSGTGGVILDDVSMLDLSSSTWSRCAAADGGEAVTVPGGPTSRHAAVPLSIERSNGESGVQNTVRLHNHRCEDHVLLLATTPAEGGSDKIFAE